MRGLPGITVSVASAVVFSICADVSHADRFTLADIRERCAAPEGSEEFAFCRGYVVALIDGVIVRHDPDCIPPMVNDYQFALIMRKYLNANTENLQLPAVDGVLGVIAETFRCTIK
jgi:Rap1a immunity proteins